MDTPTTVTITIKDENGNQYFLTPALRIKNNVLEQMSVSIEDHDKKVWFAVPMETDANPERDGKEL